MVLADSCALVAYFSRDGGGMTQSGVAAMQGHVAVSSVTVWELTRKAAIGKLPPMPTLNGSFSSWLASEGFVPLPLGWAAAEQANGLPPIHKDPMDRMLIGQALAGGLAVITSDALFAAYGVPTIW